MARRHCSSPSFQRTTARSWVAVMPGFLSGVLLHMTVVHYLLLGLHTSLTTSKVVASVKASHAPRSRGGRRTRSTSRSSPLLQEEQKSRNASPPRSPSTSSSRGRSSRSSTGRRIKQERGRKKEQSPAGAAASSSGATTAGGRASAPLAPAAQDNIGWKNTKGEEEEQTCAICLGKLHGTSTNSEDDVVSLLHLPDPNASGSKEVEERLKQTALHKFHRKCAVGELKKRRGFLCEPGFDPAEEPQRGSCPLCNHPLSSGSLSMKNCFVV
ncbi:unnamed protein product, partial [Amoebophrya sp. A120]|eukprot:GSA120T00022364001.1